LAAKIPTIKVGSVKKNSTARPLAGLSGSNWSEQQIFFTAGSSAALGPTETHIIPLKKFKPPLLT